MVYVYLGILAVYVLLFIFSASEKVPAGRKQSLLAVPFWKAASYVFHKGQRRGRSTGRKQQNWRREALSRQLGSKLKTLQPSKSANEQAEQFQILRYMLIFVTVFAGNIVCLCMWAGAQTESLLEEGGLLHRNEYGEGNIPVTLSAQVEGEEDDEVIDYIVEERIFSDEEIEGLYQQAEARLPKIIQGENDSLENVRTDLALVTAIEGYPFQISWESSNYQLIDMDGKVDNADLGEGKIIMLTAHFKYEDWMRDHQFYVQINPMVYTEKELLRKKLEDAIHVQERATRNASEMKLPVQVGERSITWREAADDTSIYFLALAVIAAGALYWGKSREVDRKLEQRRKELLLDYPEIVNKLTLYMGAGMTIRNAFMKMGEDYKKQAQTRKRYAYEEILLTCYELQSGKSEVEAYDHFGKRCQVQSYIKLSALLSQNIRRGSNDLMTALRRETEDAFAERKNLAKRLGEEAGTKLLLPMMMMLCIVMVIIMVPAYFSFTM